MEHLYKMLRQPLRVNMSELHRSEMLRDQIYLSHIDRCLEMDRLLLLA